MSNSLVNYFFKGSLEAVPRRAVLGDMAELVAGIHGLPLIAPLTNSPQLVLVEPSSPPPDLSKLETAIKPMIQTGNILLDRVTAEYGVATPARLEPDMLWSYSQAKWYINPDSAQADMVNPGDFFLWLDGKDIQYPKGNLRPKIILELEGPYATTLGEFADDVQKAIVKNDRHRLNFTRIVARGGNWCYRPNSSAMQWDAALALATRTIMSYDLQAVIHESTHGFCPDWNLFKTGIEGIPGEKFIFTADSFAFYTDFYSQWFQIINDNFNFFNQRFFKAEGDELLAKIKKDGGWGMYRAVYEMIAMLCTDMLVPLKLFPNLLSFDKSSDDYHEWPEAVKTIVAKTINQMRMGESGWKQPADEASLTRIHVDIAKLQSEYSIKLAGIDSSPIPGLNTQNGESVTFPPNSNQ